MKTCRSQSDIPVLMLTANDLEINEVIGFELGANDYVTKPFHLAVLRARIQNLLRMTAKRTKVFMRMPGFDLILQNCIIKRWADSSP